MDFDFVKSPFQFDFCRPLSGFSHSSVFDDDIIINFEPHSTIHPCKETIHSCCWDVDETTYNDPATCSDLRVGDLLKVQSRDNLIWRKALEVIGIKWITEGKVVGISRVAFGDESSTATCLSFDRRLADTISLFVLGSVHKPALVGDTQEDIGVCLECDLVGGGGLRAVVVELIRHRSVLGDSEPRERLVRQSAPNLWLNSFGLICVR